MSEESENKFMQKAKEEINHKIKLETESVNKVKSEKDKLITFQKAYEKYFNDLNQFIIESMQDFQVTEDDLPKYLKSNLSEIYHQKLQDKEDTVKEIENFKGYINHCKKEVGNNQRSLKFYKSQYNDSDFFEECQPLIDLYQEKIDLYEENQKLTEDVIDELSKISKKLEKWE